MKSYNFFLLLFFLFISFFTNAQNKQSLPKKINTDNLITKITSRHGGIYRFQNKAYKKKELAQVIKEDKLAWNYYQQYESKRKNVRIGRITAGSLLLLSMVQLSNWNIDEFKAPEEEKKFRRFTILFLGTCGAGVFAFGSKVTSKHYLRKSIYFFNENVEDKKNIGSIPLQLNLQYSGNGIGFVLNF